MHVKHVPLKTGAYTTTKQNDRLKHLDPVATADAMCPCNALSSSCKQEVPAVASNVPKKTTACDGQSNSWRVVEWRHCQAQNAIRTRFWILNKLEQEAPRHHHSSNLRRTFGLSSSSTFSGTSCFKCARRLRATGSGVSCPCSPSQITDQLHGEMGETFQSLRIRARKWQEINIYNRTNIKILLNILLSFWVAMVVLKSSSLWPSSWHEPLNESPWGYLNHHPPKQFHLDDFDMQSY